MRKLFTLFTFTVLLLVVPSQVMAMRTSSAGTPVVEAAVQTQQLGKTSDCAALASRSQDDPAPVSTSSDAPLSVTGGTAATIVTQVPPVGLYSTDSLPYHLGTGDIRVLGTVESGCRGLMALNSTGQSGVHLSVSYAGVPLNGCQDVDLPPGAVTFIPCTISSSLGDGELSITSTLPSGQVVTRSYEHVR